MNSAWSYAPIYLVNLGFKSLSTLFPARSQRHDWQTEDRAAHQRSYQVCTRCIMDTSDPDILFDAHGVCHHCRDYVEYLKHFQFSPEEGKHHLEAIVQKVRETGKGKEYDCIMGLSGGADSSFMAYQVKKLGLRPLAVHVDCGWNSELAVKNIELLVKKLEIDLYTHVVDWEEMKDLQLAFFRAAVANQDVPQDHAIFAVLYNLAVEKGIKYVLSGSNLATEAPLPPAWGYDPMDARHLYGVHRRFGRRSLKTYPTISFYRFYIYFSLLKKLEIIRPLNYMSYNKAEAIEILQKELGWRYYGGKHHESRFTKFFQAYYLPRKFGYDKRRVHLSTLILTGQISREEALREMEKEPYPEAELKEERIFVIKKLGLTEPEWEELFRRPPRTFRDYPSSFPIFTIKNQIKSLFQRLGGHHR